jgi:hypothetical protein
MILRNRQTHNQKNLNYEVKIIFASKQVTLNVYFFVPLLRNSCLLLVISCLQRRKNFLRQTLSRFLLAIAAKVLHTHTESEARLDSRGQNLPRIDSSSARKRSVVMVYSTWRKRGLR